MCLLTIVPTTEVTITKVSKFCLVGRVGILLYEYCAVFATISLIQQFCVKGKSPLVIVFCEKICSTQMCVSSVYWIGSCVECIILVPFSAGSVITAVPIRWITTTLGTAAFMCMSHEQFRFFPFGSTFCHRLGSCSIFSPRDARVTRARSKLTCETGDPIDTGCSAALDRSLRGLCQMA